MIYTIDSNTTITPAAVSANSVNTDAWNNLVFADVDGRVVNITKEGEWASVTMGVVGTTETGLPPGLLPPATNTPPPAMGSVPSTRLPQR